MSNPTNPYAAPTSVVEDIRLNDEPELASRWARLGAGMLDGLILAGLIWIPVGIVMGFSNGFMRYAQWQSANPISAGLSISLVSLFVFFVINGYLLHTNGQTLGKRLLNIKIVRSNGDAISLPRVLFLRYLPGVIASVIPVVNFIYGLVNPLLIFRQSRKCLHDHIADTIVIKA